MLKKIILSLSIVTIGTNIYAMESETTETPGATTPVESAVSTIPATQEPVQRIELGEMVTLATEAAKHAAESGKTKIEELYTQIQQDPTAKELFSKLTKYVAQVRSIWWKSSINRRQGLCNGLKDLLQEYLDKKGLVIQISYIPAKPLILDTRDQDLQNGKLALLSFVTSISSAAFCALDKSYLEATSLTVKIIESSYKLSGPFDALKFHTYVKNVSAAMNRAYNKNVHNLEQVQQFIPKKLMDELDILIAAFDTRMCVTERDILRYYGANLYAATNHMIFYATLKNILDDVSSRAIAIIEKHYKNKTEMEIRTAVCFKPKETEVVVVVEEAKPETTSEPETLDTHAETLDKPTTEHAVVTPTEIKAPALELDEVD